MISCSTCGADFEPARPWSKYCSALCKGRAQRARLGEKQRICAGCKTRYSPTISTQKYCSISCGLKHSETVRTIICEICGKKFAHQGRGWRRYCTDCRPQADRLKAVKHAIKTGKNRNPGIGSGGAQWGSKNCQWKGVEIAAPSYRGRGLKVWGRRCVCCGKTSKLEVHHVSGDRADNSFANLVVLCRSCHMLVHRRAGMSKTQLIEALDQIWPNCRIKIAERIGEALDDGVIRPEDVGVTAASGATTSGRNCLAECNSATRPRRRNAKR